MNISRFRQIKSLLLVAYDEYTWSSQQVAESQQHLRNSQPKERRNTMIRPTSVVERWAKQMVQQLGSAMILLIF